MARSIEEKVEDWAKQQFAPGSYFTKTQSINHEIDEALHNAPSKTGGSGNNYPDIKFLLQSPQGNYIPVMIEVKGTKGALIKRNDAGIPDNVNKSGEPNYTNIAKYAANGAIHYANAILRLAPSYKEVIAIGVNGYEERTGDIQHELSVWYISKENLFIPKEVAQYTDLSFLQPQHKAQFFEQLKNINLTEEEREQEKLKLEDDIEAKLKSINQKINDVLKIEVGKRVQLVTGLIMAGLGVQENGEYKVKPLQLEELQGNTDEENNDGVVIMRRVKAYLKNKHLPKEKIDMVANALSNAFLYSHLELPENGESKLRILYHDIQTDILPFLYGELHNLDFTGRLFNVLNAWVDVPDGAENDVVLTPRFVTELMAKLCLVDKDSYVWDFATGSGGFLISAMHQMIADAKATIESPMEQQRKINHIKMEQLLGIEKLADIYLLAVLNMILMQDGSANIIHGDSLVDFKGKYEQGERKGDEFPANIFLLNPPYSAEGKGFIFVQKALSMMHHGGRAAVLIQENSGSGQGLPYTENILKQNTLLASIKMPADLFIGKSAVQTAIYVFEVGKPHSKHDVVKFIDFSNDGYSRQNRRRSSQSVNLRDTDHAKDRYAEVAVLVNYGKGINGENLHYLDGCYVEDYITLSGTDWTYGQHRKIETVPTYNDFSNVVKEYLAWRIGGIIKQESDLSIDNLPQSEGGFKPFLIDKVFEKIETKTLKYKVKELPEHPEGEFTLPALTAGIINQGLSCYVPRTDATILKNVISVSANGANTGAMFFQPNEFTVLQDSYAIKLRKGELNELNSMYFIAALEKVIRKYFDWSNKAGWNKIKNLHISIPTNKSGEIDYAFIETQVRKLIAERIQQLESYLQISQSSSEDSEPIEQTIIPLVYPEYKPGFIPLYTLRAACGYFDEGQLPEEEGWIDASGLGFTPDPKRHFVVHAKGDSMLPKIKDGDLCVFEWYSAGSRNGEIVLTQSSEYDSEYGGRYTIKCYHSEKTITDEGWQHASVQLLPLNQDYEPIELDEFGEYRTIGIFKCVLN